MTKREMLAYLDAHLEELRSRGIVASGVTRMSLRRQHVNATAVRRAIEKYVPNDTTPPEQGELKGVA